MDGRDCTLTITCEKPQESDGDELYVLMTQLSGRETRRPPDKKRFEMSAGSTATLQAREPVKISLFEADAMTPDDLVGELELELGRDGEHLVEGAGAKYRVRVRWS